jgi:hypothetical protein
MLEAVSCAPEDAAELVDWIEVRSAVTCRRILVTEFAS